MWAGRGVSASSEATCQLPLGGSLAASTARDYERSDGMLGRIIVDGQKSGLGTTHQLVPVAGQVTDRLAKRVCAVT